MLARVLGVIPVIIGASILVFVSMRILPGDPVTVLAEGSPLTEEQREVLAERYDLDESIPRQYLNWVGDAITWRLRALAQVESARGRHHR